MISLGSPGSVAVGVGAGTQPLSGGLEAGQRSERGRCLLINTQLDGATLSKYKCNARKLI